MSTRRGSYRSRIGLTAVIRAIAVLVVSILIAATAIPAVHVRATPTQSHGSESRSQEYESRPRDYILRGSMSGELSPRALEEVSGLRGLRGGGRSTSDGSRRTHNLASSSAAPALPLPTHPPQPPSIHARGLVNSGNTCYVNAVMQVLVRCTSFRSMLMRNGVDGVRLNSFEYPLVNFLKWLMRELSTPISRPIDISFLRDYMVDSHPQSFRMGQQEDAAELLFHLVRDLRVELDHVVPVDAAFDDDFDWVGDVDVGGDEFLETLPVDILSPEVGTVDDALAKIDREAGNMPHAAPPKILALTVARYTDRQGVVRKPLEFGYALMYHGMRYRLAGAIYRHGNGVTTGHYTSTACHRGNCILTDDEQITAHRGFDMTAFRDVTLLIYERDDL